MWGERDNWGERRGRVKSKNMLNGPMDETTRRGLNVGGGGDRATESNGGEGTRINCN